MFQRSEINDDVLRLCIVFIVLTVAATALRFVLRAKSSLKFGSDDLWIVISCISFYGYLAIVLYARRLAPFETNYLLLPYSSLQAVLKLQYAAAPLFILTIAASKLSIIFLYCRIFITPATPEFRSASSMALVAVFLYWLGGTACCLFQCWPIREVWNPLGKSRCLNFARMFFVLELYNCILDLVILYLPLRMVRTLHVPLAKKIGLGAIFLLGSLVFVVGIIHNAVCFNPASSNLAIVPNTFISTVEVGLAILCACMPTYGPIISKISPCLVFLSSRFALSLSSRHRKTGPTSMGDDSRSGQHGSPRVLLKEVAPTKAARQAKFTIIECEEPSECV